MGVGNVVISTLDHRRPAAAAAILQVQRAAYALEAHLLGISRFPPLDRTANDIEISEAVFTYLLWHLVWPNLHLA